MRKYLDLIEVEPKYLYTQRSLAKKLNLSPAEINSRVANGEYPLIITSAGEFIYYKEK